MFRGIRCATSTALALLLLLPAPAIAAADAPYLVHDINSGEGSSSPQETTVFEDRLFFSSDDGTHGTELWVSNGTTAGIELVKDINTGGAYSSPTELTAVGNLLYFRADDGAHGSELWAYQLPGTTITASPLSITADGTSTSTITVQARDANGNRLTTGGDAVTPTTSAGTLPDVTDNTDGTYTTTLTSATSTGSALVSGTLNRVALTDPATVTFTAAPEPAAPEPDGPGFQFDDVPADSVHAKAIYRMRQYDITVGTSETTFDPSGDLSRGQMSTFLVRLLMLTDSSIEQPVDHEVAMALLVDKGLLLGDANGNLNGAGTLTRGQAASLLARLVEDVTGEALNASEREFSDVAMTDTHAGNIAKVVESGVIHGYADNTFRASTELRRDQMASMLSRTIDLLITSGDIEDFDA